MISIDQFVANNSQTLTGVAGATMWMAFVLCLLQIGAGMIRFWKGKLKKDEW